MRKNLLLLFGLILLINACDDPEYAEPAPSYARFNYTLGAVDYRDVSFTGAGDPDITTYNWDFADGSTATGENVTHTFARPGNYLVTLTTNSPNGNVTYETVVSVLPEEDAATFNEIASITIGGEGAAEISTYDPQSFRLFVVNNEGDSKVDVIDISNPASPVLETSIDMSGFGGGVNSVAVKDGLLAAAVEANNKQDNGQVVIMDVSNFNVLAQVTAGALPDMVTFSPDGAYILAANEGEPDDDYLNDPEGSITIISTNGFTAQTATFTAFNSQEAALEAEGFRVFGPNATLAQDVEPEYITVSDDSRTAYVALQENNGLAVVDIASATVTEIIPLGNKDYSVAGNEIDPSNEDGVIEFRSVPALGTYQPDAIEYFMSGGNGYIITANEGDAREYEGSPGYVGEDRVADVVLDPTAFPNAAELQDDANLGRLKLMLSEGDIDGDGDYDVIHSYGARSFSIWDASGNLVFDSGNELEVEINNLGLYDDGRSDDKGVEPEGVTVGEVGGSQIAFVGLERVDAVAVYDVSNPTSPQFLTILVAGDAPEGILFLPKEETANGRSLLVVSSEDDGSVKIYMTM